MKEVMKKIQAIFGQAENQSQALNRIYGLFIPDWSSVVSVKGKPSCGKSLYRLIVRYFHIFDYENHPETLPLSLWSNKGFVENSMLGEWEVDLSGCRIEKDDNLCLD